MRLIIHHLFFYKTFSFNNSKVIYPYIEQLMLNKVGDVLKNSLIIDNGSILDEEIINYQNQK